MLRQWQMCINCCMKCLCCVEWADSGDGERVNERLSGERMRERPSLFSNWMRLRFAIASMRNERVGPAKWNRRGERCAETAINFLQELIPNTPLTMNHSPNTELIVKILCRYSSTEQWKQYHISLRFPGASSGLIWWWCRVSQSTQSMRRRFDFIFLFFRTHRRRRQLLCALFNWLDDWLQIIVHLLLPLFGLFALNESPLSNWFSASETEWIRSSTRRMASLSNAV